MQLTRHTDYALRVLMHLAAKGDDLATIREISDLHRISENHLMKVVSRLASRGYVATLRGKGGGLRLARAASKINVGEVIRDTEESLHVVECMAKDYGGDCALSPSCRLKSALHAAQGAFFETLSQYSLEDLTPKRGRAAPLRFHPKNAAPLSA
jgi:Rrf2 family nitric oxide-sensitive transcriptional repressor